MSPERTPVHPKGTCQWCDLYRAQSIPLPGHCPEPDIRADMELSARLPDPLEGFAEFTSDGAAPPLPCSLNRSACPGRA
jgi:hypothetical protein